MRKELEGSLNVSKGVMDSLYVYAYKNDPVVSV